MDVAVKQLRKRFGNTTAVAGVDLHIRDGELFTLLGPSGCGKTTILRCIVGLEQPDSGQVLFGSEDVTHVPANRRPCGMVFQNYALYPHMTVFDNVSYGLKVRLFQRGGILQKAAVLAGRLGGVSRRSDIQAATNKVLALLELEGLQNRYPSQLSGGQQQRVALARALVTEPQVLLLDEPLAALDAKLRVRVRQEIRMIQQRLGITTVYVTHDQEEALAVSDRVAIMKSGNLVQVGTPEEIYQQPATAFVADFLGLANIFPGRVGPGGFHLEDGRVVACASPVEGATRMMIRPEAVRIVRDERDASANVWSGTVETKTFYGSLTRLTVKSGGVSLIVDVPDPVVVQVPNPGDTVKVHLPPQRVLTLPE